MTVACSATSPQADPAPTETPTEPAMSPADQILGLTLDHGGDVTSTNRFGGTALIPASEHGHVSTVRILLDAGVPVNHVNDLAWTALHEAIVLGAGSADHIEVVRMPARRRRGPRRDSPDEPLARSWGAWRALLRPSIRGLRGWTNLIDTMYTSCP